MKIKLSKTEMQISLFKYAYGISKLISYSQLATIAYVMFYRQASTFLVEHVFYMKVKVRRKCFRVSSGKGKFTQEINLYKINN